MADLPLATLVVDAAVGAFALFASQAHFLHGDTESDGYALALIELEVSHDGNRRKYSFSRGALIGRSASAQVVLPDASVSRLHARIENRGGTVVVEDLGSRNGTSLNGRPLREATEIQPGDEISIGAWRIIFRGVGGWK